MFNINLHFNELKIRIYYLVFGLIITFFHCYFYAPQIINLLSRPILKFISFNSSDFIFLSIFEVFNTYLILSFYISIYLYVPIVCYFFFIFLKPGLYNSEKKFILSIIKLFVKSNFFLLFFFYFIIFPSILSFFLNLDVIVNSNFIILKMQTKIYEYITFLCKFFTFYCITLSLVPLLTFTFIFSKLVDFDFFYRKRKFLIVFALFIGCIFSSPDLISLFCTSIPVLIFFEITIFFLILKSKYKKFFIF